MCSKSLWMNEVFVLFVDNQYTKMYRSLHMYEYGTIVSSIPVFSVGGRIFEGSLFCPNSKTKVEVFVEYISVMFLNKIYLYIYSYKEHAKECFVEIRIWIVYRFILA